MEEMKEEVISVSHFSHHHHPLVRTNLGASDRNITCSGCNLSIISGKEYYRCKICTFSLHKVCYNMPRKTRHAGHPNHYLNLLVMPSSAQGNFKCKACGLHISGFYYNCVECGFYYHILCSALPLSIAITSHLHSLKLEFSLPYDFECDLCKKPCYNGWLYRCCLCEFDAHLACAVANQRTQFLHHRSTSAPLPDPLSRQIIYSSASVMDQPGRRIDYSSESSELMQLVAHAIARSNREGINVVGWDEKLHSPREKLKIRNGKIEFTRPDNIAAISPIPGGNLKLVDQTNIPSGELSTLPSYQFSDSYFSIDLARSYSHRDPPNQEKNEANAGQNGEEIITYRNNSMLDRITANLEPEASAKQLSKPSLSFHYSGPEYRIHESFLRGSGNDTEERLGQKKKKKKNEISTKNQNSMPDTVSSIIRTYNLFIYLQ